MIGIKEELNIHEKVDYFSEQASNYFTYRPFYPESLFKFLSETCSKTELAWDCATGNGQAAVGLSRYFDHVIATDNSADQLKNAHRKANITYQVSFAENSALAAHSADLITIAQALHWFKLAAFYNEVNRVAKPNSVIAAWCYSNSFIDDDVDEIINSLYTTIISGEIMTPQRSYVYEQYQTISFPFQKLNTPDFFIRERWTLEHLVGYLRTWPGVKDYYAKYNKDIISDVYPHLVRAWGDSQSERDIKWPLYLLVGRVKPD